MKKHNKLAEIFSVKIENYGVFVYIHSNNGNVTGPRADKVSKLLYKLFKRCLITFVKITLIAFAGFFRDFLYDFGDITTPRYH